MFGPLLDDRVRRNERFFQRLIAISVVVVFSLFDAVRFAPQVYADPADPAHASFSIPKELGTVDESYRGTSDKTVIFIQDAHDSLQAQENIARLIGKLVKDKGIRTVFEEGYEGPVPTNQFFGFIKDPQIKQRASYFLLDKLRIGGAEYAHINRAMEFKLIGVEDLKLYGENIKCYRESSKSRAAIEEDLKELLSRITILANQHFPKDLKTWLKQKELFSEGKLPLLNYLKELQSLYSKSRQTRSARQFAVEYPGTAILLLAQTSRDSKLIKQLNALDSKVVFEEVLQLEKDVSNSLLLSARDGQIFLYYQGLNLLQRLNRIELTQPEYEAVRGTLLNLQTRKLADFIVSQTRKPLVLSKEWERHIKDAVRFYDVAQKRDGTIDQNIRAFRESGEETAILVFGGFHASAIKEILCERQISYHVISPAIGTIDKKHQDYYKCLMAEGQHPFEVPFLAVRANKPPGSFYLAATGKEPFVRAELRAIASSVEALGDNSDPQLIERRLAEFKLSQPNARSMNMGMRAPQTRSEMRDKNRYDKVVTEHFLKQTPILWGELHMTEDEYFKPGHLEEAKALAGVFESLQASPNQYLVEVLDLAQDDLRVVAKPEWQKAVKELIDRVQVPKQGQKFPLQNIAYQALVEMVRRWHKKDRHTHVSASIPLEMIHQGIAGLPVKIQGYRRLLVSYVKKRKDRLTKDEKPEYAATMAAFESFLGQYEGEEIPLEKIREFMEKPRHGKRELQDIWMDVLGWIAEEAPDISPENRVKAQTAYNEAFVEVILNVVRQNFSDGIYDLELRFNPFKTLGSDPKVNLDSFLAGLTSKLKEIEAEADGILGGAHKVCFMFSIGREKMEGDKWKTGKWDEKFKLLKELKGKTPNSEQDYNDRLKGIDIAGAEPLGSKSSLEICNTFLVNLLTILLNIGSSVRRAAGQREGVSSKFESKLEDFIRNLQEGESTKVINDTKKAFNLTEINKHLKKLRLVGYDTTIHLGDFFGTSGGNRDSIRHAAFVNAHLDALKFDYLDPMEKGQKRLGHGRIFTNRKSWRGARQNSSPKWWKPAVQAETELLARAHAHNYTVETCPDRGADDILTLRDNYPNSGWYEDGTRLNVLYGSDGLDPEKSVTLSQWLVRLMLASPTPPRMAGMAPTGGITVGEMEKATRALSDDGPLRQVSPDDKDRRSETRTSLGKQVMDQRPEDGGQEAVGTMIESNAQSRVMLYRLTDPGLKEIADMVPVFQKDILTPQRMHELIEIKKQFNPENREIGGSYRGQEADQLFWLATNSDHASYEGFHPLSWDGRNIRGLLQQYIESKKDTRTYPQEEIYPDKERRHVSIIQSGSAFPSGSPEPRLATMLLELFALGASEVKVKETSQWDGSTSRNVDFPWKHPLDSEARNRSFEYVQLDPDKWGHHVMLRMPEDLYDQKFGERDKRIEQTAPSFKAYKTTDPDLQQIVKLVPLFQQKVLNSERLRYLLAIKKMVNPDNLFENGLYAASGVDQLFWLVTNATTGYFVDSNELKFHTDHYMISDEYGSYGDRKVLVSDQAALLQYITRKGNNPGAGTSTTELIDIAKERDAEPICSIFKGKLLAPLLLELFALGARDVKIRVVPEKGVEIWKVEFKWKHPEDAEEKPRTLFYVSAHSSLAIPDHLKHPIQMYMEKGADNDQLEIHPIIAKLLPEKGVVVTNGRGSVSFDESSRTFFNSVTGVLSGQFREILPNLAVTDAERKGLKFGYGPVQVFEKLLVIRSELRGITSFVDGLGAHADSRLIERRLAALNQSREAQSHGATNASAEMRSEMRETISDLSTVKARISEVWEERRQRHNSFTDRPKVAEPIKKLDRDGFLLKGAYNDVGIHNPENSLNPNPPEAQAPAAPKWAFGNDEDLSLLLMKVDMDGERGRVLLTLDSELSNESLLMLDRATPLVLTDVRANLALLKFHRRSGLKGYINLWGIGSLNRLHDHILDDMPIFGLPLASLNRKVDGLEAREVLGYGASTLVYTDNDDEKLAKVMARTAAILLEKKIPHQVFLDAGKVVFVLRNRDPKVLHEIEGEYFEHHYLTGHFVGGIVGYPEDILNKITPEIYQNIMRRAGQPRNVRDNIAAHLAKKDWKTTRLLPFLALSAGIGLTYLVRAAENWSLSWPALRSVQLSATILGGMIMLTVSNYLGQVKTKGLTPNLRRSVVLALSCLPIMLFYFALKPALRIHFEALGALWMTALDNITSAVLGPLFSMWAFLMQARFGGMERSLSAQKQSENFWYSFGVRGVTWALFNMLIFSMPISWSFAIPILSESINFALGVFGGTIMYMPLKSNRMRSSAEAAGRAFPLLTLSYVSAVYFNSWLVLIPAIVAGRLLVRFISNDYLPWTRKLLAGRSATEVVTPSQHSHRSEMRESVLMGPEIPRTFAEQETDVEFFDQKSMRIGLEVTPSAFRENGESRVVFDRINDVLRVGGERRRFGVQEDITTPVSDFGKEDMKDPNRKVFVLTNGNLSFNNFYIGVVNGKVYYHSKDPLTPRTMLVVRNNNPEPEVMELAFKKQENGTVRVLDPKANGLDITDDISMAVYGLPLVKPNEKGKGEENLAELFGQLDDLRHWARFPMFQFKAGGQCHLGMSDGVGLFYEDPRIREQLLRGLPVTLSLDPVLRKGVTFDEVRRVYDAWGYGGRYTLDEDLRTLTVAYEPGTHPHSYFGITEDGKWFVGSEKGGKEGLQTHFRGTSLKRLAEELIRKHKVKYVWVWANGKDVGLEPGNLDTQAAGLRKRFVEALVVSKPKALAPYLNGTKSLSSEVKAALSISSDRSEMRDPMAAETATRSFLGRSEMRESVSGYVMDNYQILAGRVNTLTDTEIQKSGWLKNMDALFAKARFRQNFIESLGDLIIVALMSQPDGKSPVLDDFFDRLSSEKDGNKIIELVGQLQMLYFETYTFRERTREQLTNALLAHYAWGADIDTVIRLAQSRRMLEYLNKNEILSEGDVNSYREKIDRMDPSILNSDVVRNMKNDIGKMLENKLKNDLVVEKISPKQAEFERSQIRKVHKSVRGIDWGGEAHAQLTIDKVRSGAGIHVGYLKVDGKEKMISLELEAGTFLRTAAVLDIAQGMGIGSKLIREGVKSVLAEGYTNVHWHVLDNNQESNGMSNKFRDNVLGVRSDAPYQQNVVNVIEASAREHFGQDAGIYTDSKNPEANDRPGYPRFAFTYEFSFLKPEAKEQIVRKYKALGMAQDESIRILDFIGTKGLARMAEYMRSVPEDQRSAVWPLVVKIVALLESDKDNSGWVYKRAYYDFILDPESGRDPARRIPFLEKIEKFLSEEKAQAELVKPTETILHALVNSHAEKKKRDTLQADELASHDRAANDIKKRLNSAGVETFEVRSKTGEKTIIGVVGDVRDPGGRTLIFDCHYDVKTVTGRKAAEHYRPGLMWENGKIVKVSYGPGSYDMLGSGAALLAAIEKMGKKISGPNSCVFVFDPDEEHGGHHGTELAAGDLFKRFPGLKQKNQDGKVEVAILEPTDLALNTRHRAIIAATVMFGGGSQRDSKTALLKEFHSGTEHTAFFDKNNAEKSAIKQMLDYFEKNEGEIYPVDIEVGDRVGDELVPSDGNAPPTCVRLKYTADEKKGSPEAAKLLSFLADYWKVKFVSLPYSGPDVFGTDGVSYGVNVARTNEGWTVSLNTRIFADESTTRDVIGRQITDMVENNHGILVGINDPRDHGIHYVPFIYKDESEVALAADLKAHMPGQNEKDPSEDRDYFGKVSGHPEFWGGTVSRYYQRQGVRNIVIWGPLGANPHAKGEYVHSRSLGYMAVTLRGLLRERLGIKERLPDLMRVDAGSQASSAADGRSEMRSPGTALQAHIQQMKSYFTGLSVPTGTMADIMRDLETLPSRSPELFSDGEFEKFYSDTEHGFEHSLQVTRKIFEWVRDFSLEQEVDLNVLAAGAFLHDIKGLEAKGNDKRKTHHIEGAVVAGLILRNMEWNEDRIGKVKKVIEQHRGIPESYKASNYPEGYVSKETKETDAAKRKPVPDTLEAQLVRDADTFIELDNPARLKAITLDFRGKHSELNFSTSFYAPGHPGLYGGAGQELEGRLAVILDSQKRNLAVNTDVLEFLLGRLLETCDPSYYFLREVQESVSDNAPKYFEKFLRLVNDESIAQGEDPAKVMTVIEGVILEMGKAKTEGDVTHWKALNKVHLDAFQKASAVYRSEMRDIENISKTGQDPTAVTRIREEFETILNKTKNLSAVQLLEEAETRLKKQQKLDLVKEIQDLLALLDNPKADFPKGTLSDPAKPSSHLNLAYLALVEVFRAIPKVDQHIHISNSLNPKVVWDLYNAQSSKNQRKIRRAAQELALDDYLVVYGKSLNVYGKRREVKAFWGKYLLAYVLVKLPWIRQWLIEHVLEGGNLRRAAILSDDTKLMAFHPARAWASLETLRHHVISQSQPDRLSYKGDVRDTSILTLKDYEQAGESVAKEVFEDGVTSFELRTNLYKPRLMRDADDNPLSVKEVVKQVLGAAHRGFAAAEADARAQGREGCEAKILLSFSRPWEWSPGEKILDPKIDLLVAIIKSVRELKDEEALGAYRVVGVDISGANEMASDQYFRVLEAAREADLVRTIHLGERRNDHGERFHLEDTLDMFDKVFPENELPKIDRIGHGLALGSVPDDFLGEKDTEGNAYTRDRIDVLNKRIGKIIEEVKRKKIMIEICPSTNLRSDKISDYRGHSFHELERKGVLTGFGIDGFWFWRGTLSEEIARLYLASPDYITFNRIEKIASGRSEMRDDSVTPEQREWFDSMTFQSSEERQTLWQLLQTINRHGQYSYWIEMDADPDVHVEVDVMKLLKNLCQSEAYKRFLGPSERTSILRTFGEILVYVEGIEGAVELLRSILGAESFKKLTDPVVRGKVFKTFSAILKYSKKINSVAALAAFGALLGGEGFGRITDPTERMQVLDKFIEIAEEIPEFAVKGSGAAFSCFRTLLGGHGFNRITDPEERMRVLDKFVEIAKEIHGYSKRDHLAYIAFGALLGGEGFGRITDATERMQVLDKFLEIAKKIGGYAGRNGDSVLETFGKLLGGKGFGRITDAAERAQVLDEVFEITKGVFFAEENGWQALRDLGSLLGGEGFGGITDSEERMAFLEILRFTLPAINKKVGEWLSSIDADLSLIMDSPDGRLKQGLTHILNEFTGVLAITEDEAERQKAAEKAYETFIILCQKARALNFGFMQALAAWRPENESPETLVTLGAKINAGQKDKEIAEPTDNPAELAHWLIERRNGKASQEAQISIGFDTGTEGASVDEGKYLALYLWIAGVSFKDFRALSPRPKRDDGAADGLLILGQAVQSKRPGQQWNRRLDFLLNLNGDMTEKDLELFLRQIRLFSLGMLLASAEEAWERIFPGGQPEFMKKDPRLLRLAASYRKFRERMVAFLREYNRYDDPELISRPIREGQLSAESVSDHSEHVRARMNGQPVEEVLYPVSRWLVSFGSEVELWDKLLPKMRKLEALALDISASHDKPDAQGDVRPVGRKFVQDMRVLGYSAMEEMQDILDGRKTLEASKGSRDPFLATGSDADKKKYLRTIIEGIESNVISEVDLPDQNAFREALNSFGIEPPKRSELRDQTTLPGVRANRPEKIPQREPARVPMPEKVPAPRPEPAPSTPLPAPRPSPAPAKPAPAPLEPVKTLGDQTAWNNRPERIPQREPATVPMPEKVPAPKPVPAPVPRREPIRQPQPHPSKPDLVPAGVGMGALRRTVFRNELSETRADRMVRSIRQSAQPATVFVDAEDFLNLSLAQKREYLLVMLSSKAVRMVVYNERAELRDPLFDALLKLDRVTRTRKDLSGAQASFDRPNAPSLHLSKQILPSQELVQRLSKRISFFKTQGQNGGTLAAALLWAWSGGEDARVREVSQGRDGFWIVAETFVNALQRSYANNLVLAIAA